MKPHVFRELVNELRDTAVEFHAHQSLRERLSGVLHKAIAISGDPAVRNNSHKDVAIRRAAEENRKLMDENVRLRNDCESFRDMLEDARQSLDMLREALGVPFEPHQSLFDRMHEAAQGASAALQTGCAP